METVVVALATHPEPEGARRIATALVEEGLAACVQVLPGVSSTYRWKGAVESATELRLEIKTTSGRLEALTRRLVELHPYEVPELVVLEAAGGLPAYLAWVRESVGE